MKMGQDFFFYAIDKKRSEIELKNLQKEIFEIGEFGVHLGLYGIVLNPSLSLTFLKEIIEGEYQDLAYLATKNKVFANMNKATLKNFKQSCEISKNPLVRKFLDQDQKYNELLESLKRQDLRTEDFANILKLALLDSLDLRNYHAILNQGYAWISTPKSPEDLISNLGISNLIENHQELNALIEFFSNSYYEKMVWHILKNSSFDIGKRENVELLDNHRYVDFKTISERSKFYYFPPTKILEFAPLEGASSWLNELYEGFDVTVMFGLLNDFIPLRIKFALQTKCDSRFLIFDDSVFDLFSDVRVDLQSCLKFSHPSCVDSDRILYLKQNAYRWKFSTASESGWTESDVLDFFTSIFTYAAAVCYLEDSKTIDLILKKLKKYYSELTQFCLAWNPNLSSAQKKILHQLENDTVKSYIAEFAENFTIEIYEEELKSPQEKKMKGLISHNLLYYSSKQSQTREQIKLRTPNL